jgi:hypothetical protein
VNLYLQINNLGCIISKKNNRIKKLFNKILLFSILMPVTLSVYAQKKATVAGKVLNEEDKPLGGVTVSLLNGFEKTSTNDSGLFSITLPANKPVALVFSYTGYTVAQKNFNLSDEEKENVAIKLSPQVNKLSDVTVKDQAQRRQSGLININPEYALVNPSPLGNIESLIKIFVGSNNELTSQYSVRGGSYDENLIYVNDFEIYKPYLVQSGQQEGLSFINPDLTSNVKFYAGGFQAKYGDKLSSVLDVTYKKPTTNGGSIYLGLLEQGLHLEGVFDKNKVTYLIGVRNRSNKNLLSSQSTQGNYIPSSSDLQALITWQAAKKLRLEAFTNLSGTRFNFFPAEAQLTSSVFSPIYSGNVGVDIFYEGQEHDKYATHFVGLTAVQQLSTTLQLKWMMSYYDDNEEQNEDISGAYLFGERNFDNGSNGAITNPGGSGVDQNYARNKLNIDVYSLQHKGSFNKGRNYFQWGNAIDFQNTNSKIHSFEYLDSAGYSLPYNPTTLSVHAYANGDTVFTATRFSGYLQDNIQFKDSSDFILQAGIRYNYNTLNNEFLLSPRIGFSFKPKNWQKDILFKGSAGIYDQPPFYREMVKYDGSINTNLKAQKSWQATFGLDYNFPLWNGPGRLTTEIYYKNMWDVVPYDVDNVEIKYYGENMAKAYAAGIETRLFGNIVKDAESWISLSFMHTKENLDNDFYTTYYNKAGEIITPETPDKVVADSSVNAVGWLRRPNDRLITFGMFFQDYLSTNKNIKVYFTTIYGSNLPYNIPGSIRYRNALEIDPYIRADIGFGALLYNPEKPRRSHSPFNGFKGIWASLEIFNLINRENTISYQLIKDYNNNIYTIPERLTPRLLNFKIAASW